MWKSDEPPLPRSLLVDSTFTARWMERTNRNADPEQALREQLCQPHDARYLFCDIPGNSVKKFGLPLESSGSIELPVSQLSPALTSLHPWTQMSSAAVVCAARCAMRRPECLTTLHIATVRIAVGVAAHRSSRGHRSAKANSDSLRERRTRCGGPAECARSVRTAALH